MKHLLSSLMVVALALGISSSALAQGEINLLAPGPIREPLDKLISIYQTKTGTHVKVTYAGGVPSRKQVAEGKGLDVDLLFAPFPEVLKTGNVDPHSATVVARARLALAVKKARPSRTFPLPPRLKRRCWRRSPSLRWTRNKEASAGSRRRASISWALPIR